jgi:hypothetical protein
MMSRDLDRLFFVPVAQKDHEGTSYSAYRMIGCPMVLFSEVDGAPLAALHLRCQETDKQLRGRAIIAERQPPLKPKPKQTPVASTATAASGASSTAASGASSTAASGAASTAASGAASVAALASTSESKKSSGAQPQPQPQPQPQSQSQPQPQPQQHPHPQSQPQPQPQPQPKPQPQPQQFQGMIDRDGQEFELVITNLAQTGMINFNLMRCVDPVREVNPRGLNEINELRPNESYAIQCDQNADNKPLKLCSIKNESGKAVLSVEQDLKAAEKDLSKAQGTNLFLSVVPQCGNTSDMKKLCDQFAKTIWRCVPSGLMVISRLVRPKEAESSFSCEAESSFSFEANRGVSMDARSAGSSAFQSRDNSKGIKRRRKSKGSMDTENYASKDGELEAATKDVIEDEEEDKAYDGGASTKQVLEIGMKKMSAVPAGRDVFDTIMDSRASRIQYGERHIDVNSSQTGNEYDYDRAARPCVLGLSVSLELCFAIKQSLDDADLRTEAMALISTYAQSKYADFLAGKLHLVDECVICLSEGPDVVFFSCGHCCTHRQCAKTLLKCPLCRGLVVARLQPPTKTLVPPLPPTAPQSFLAL